MALSLAHRDASAFSPAMADLFGPYLGHVNLTLVPGTEPEPGFTTLPQDRDAQAVLMDLPAASIETVLAPRLLHRVPDLIPLMREIHRVLKPGCHLLIVSPYASSDDAWQDPTTVRAFTEKSWHYFDRRLYERTGQRTEIDVCFEVVDVGMLPFPDMEAAAAQAARHGQLNALDVWKRTQRNVIREMNVVLRKVDG